MASPGSPHPAQTALAAAKREVGRQGLGPGSGGGQALDADALRRGVVRADLDACAEDELRVVNGLLRRAAEAELREVRLALSGPPSTAASMSVASSSSSARTAMASKRRVRRADAGKAAILRVEPNLLLCTALKAGLRASGAHIVRLDLHGVKLRPQGAHEVGMGLARARALRKLSLRSSRLGDEAFTAMHLGIAKNESIQTLGLADCALTDRSAGAVAHILRCHAQRRSDARWGRSLRRTGLHEAMLLQPEEFNEIAMSGILVLDLAANGFGDGIARAIAHETVADDWVGAINLRDNAIGKAGATALLDALEQSNDGLAVLDLRGNHVKSVAARIDALLRSRSAFPNAGILSRALPEGSQTGESQEDPDVVETFPVCVIAAAILEWQSGHQIAPDLTSLVTSLGMMVEEGALAVVNSAPPEAAAGRAHDRDSARENRGPNRGAQAARLRDGEAASRFQSYRPGREERLSTQLDAAASGVRPKKYAGAGRHAPVSGTDAQPASRSQRRPKPKKKRKTKTKRTSQADRVAEAFAEEVNKALAEYTAGMDGDEVSLVRTNPEALTLLEKSVQQLNEQLDRHPRSPAHADQEFPGAVEPTATSREADHLQADALAQNVAARLSQLWATSDLADAE